MIVRKILTFFGFDVEDGKLKKVGDQVERVKGGMHGAAQETSSLASGLKNVAASVLGLAAITQVGRGMMDSIIQVDDLKASLETVTGSAGAAETAFQQINKFSRETPFMMSEVADAFVKLTAMGLDPSERALTSYGDTASAMGKELNQMIEAVADAATGEFERLKEFGIKAKSEGNKVTFTFKGVKTTVKKESKEIQEYLLNIGETEFAGGMERKSKTLGGVISNLKGAFVDFSVAVGEAGLRQSLVKLFNTILNFDTGSLSLSDTLGRLLARAVDKVRDSLLWLSKNIDIVIKRAKQIAVAFTVKTALSGVQQLTEWVKNLGSASAIASAKGLLAIAPYVLLGLVIDDLVAFAQGRDSLIGDLLADDKETADELRESLLTVWESLVGGWNEVKPSLTELWEALGGTEGIVGAIVWVTKALAWLLTGFINTLTSVGQFIGWLVAVIYTSFADLEDNLAELWHNIVVAFQNTWTQLTTWFEQACDAIGEVWHVVMVAFRNMWVWLVDGMKTVWKTITDPIVAVWDAIWLAGAAVAKSIAGIFNRMVESVVGVVNDLIDGVNSVANALGLDGLDSLSAKSFQFDLGESPLEQRKRQRGEAAQQIGDITGERQRMILAGAMMKVNASKLGNAITNAPTLNQTIQVTNTNATPDQIMKVALEGAKKVFDEQVANTFRNVAKVAS